MTRAAWIRLVLFLVALGVTGALWSRALKSKTESKTVPYSELMAAIEQDTVAEVLVESERLVATLKNRDGNAREQSLVASRLPNVDERELVTKLTEKGIAFTGRIEQNSLWPAVLSSIFPLVMLFFLFRAMSGMMGGGQGARPMSFGKSQAKIFDRSAENPTTFADVAGVEESKNELIEVVNYLKDPEKYRAVGARVPKGVLLVGPPGTGKTLLARAVAGESKVPFFSMSGSEFVEMFVGVGASRVRDLFTQAKERAPCIVFIDELDAVGKTRAGGGVFAANEEREQTLNQLLVEMDGFDASVGIVIMAATNRPEVLDKALLRAGRFDRQVLVDRPDVRGREAILNVHAKRLTMKGVDLKLVAQRTPGMVGADLANVVNEAALACARRDSKTVEQHDFEEAVDRLQLGLRKDGRVMNEQERRRVAWHESGHALVALTVKHADPVHRVTIIPRSIGALGATLQLPTEDRYLMTEEELKDALVVLLGGRTAEEIVFTDVSTGASNDLERASELARQMVCRFGMSPLGAQTFGRPGGSQYLGGAVSFEERNFSEATAQAIDEQVHRLIEDAHQTAKTVLIERRAVLDVIANALLEKETLERGALEALVRGT
ncbi:MAG: ATP-dependent zinc metalloprotease FtsH [Myxococcales bacterium]|nr:ATP-dependent zinc metalloprotease FtsH [Myxococcales bacterium]